jgi:flavodoxin I
VLIVYDSVYGNTREVAEALGNAIGADALVVKADQVETAQLENIDLLIVGSPTQGGRPTKPVQDFIASLPEAVAKGLKIASFDTRYASRFAKVFGFAANRIAERLKEKGGIIASPPEPFIVTGKKGPLKDGELERAGRWARGIAR